MKVFGIPSKSLTRAAMGDVQTELIKRGIPAAWNIAGVLVIDADRPDIHIQDVLAATEADGFAWVIRMALERAMQQGA